MITFHKPHMSRKEVFHMEALNIGHFERSDKSMALIYNDSSLCSE